MVMIDDDDEYFQFLFFSLHAMRGEVVVIHQNMNGNCSDHDSAIALDIRNANGYFLFLFYFSLSIL